MTETILLEPIYTTTRTQPKQTNKCIDMIILEAVDESLATFGDCVRQVIYFQLENKHNVGKLEIPAKIKELEATIEEIFGLGARLIEMKIIETLYAKVNGFAFKPKGTDLVFREYIETIRAFSDSA